MTLIYCCDGELIKAEVKHGIFGARIRIALGASLTKINGKKIYIPRRKVQALSEQ